MCVHDIGDTLRLQCVRVSRLIDPSFIHWTSILVCTWDIVVAFVEQLTTLEYSAYGSCDDNGQTLCVCVCVCVCVCAGIKTHINPFHYGWIGQTTGPKIDTHLMDNHHQGYDSQDNSRQKVVYIFHTLCCHLLSTSKRQRQTNSLS